MGWSDQNRAEGGFETLEVVVGQRAEPALGGVQGVVTGYAGLGTRHVMVIADAASGPVSTRQAPQTAAAALVARVKTSLFRTPRERLVEALADADRAVSAAASGTHAHGRSGCGLVCVYFDLTGATFARVGGGKAYVVVGRNFETIFDRVAAGYVGDGVSQPEIRAQLGSLPRGARIVLLSDATAAAVAGDLGSVIFGIPPQLAAVRVVEAARRRGKREALACLILELQSDLARPYHPAVGRAERYEEPPLTGVPGVPGGSRSLPKRSAIYGADERQRATGSGSWVWQGVVALCLGIGAAFWAQPWESTAGNEDQLAALIEQGNVVVQSMPDVSQDGPQLPIPDIPVAVGALDAQNNPNNENSGPDERVGLNSGPANANERSIARAFAQPTPKKAAMALMRHLRKRFRRRGYPAYEEVSVWVKAHKNRHVLQTLGYMLKGKQPFRVRRWLSKLMPELLESP